MRTGYDLHEGAAILAGRIGGTMTKQQMEQEGKLARCPRCERNYFTPRDAGAKVSYEHVMEYPYPALSRVARIDICSPCGQDEALRDFSGAGPVPPYDWPIEHAPESAL